MSAPRGPSGFTLVELVLSASVMAGILAAAYLCLEAGFRSSERSDSRMDLGQNARVALALLSADLRSASPLSEEFEFIGMNRKLDGQEADNLDFATHHYSPRAPGEGDFCEVSYFVDRDPETGLSGLWRRQDPSPDDDPLGGGTKEEIATGLRAFNLEYYDGFTWHDEWGKTMEAPPDRRGTGGLGRGAPRKELGERPPELEAPRASFYSNLYGLPDAVRITLAFSDAVPPSREERTQSPGTDPPLLFQTVVHLNLARRSALMSSGAGGDSASGSASFEVEQR